MQIRAQLGRNASRLIDKPCGHDESSKQTNEGKSLVQPKDIDKHVQEEADGQASGSFTVIGPSQDSRQHHRRVWPPTQSTG